MGFHYALSPYLDKRFKTAFKTKAVQLKVTRFSNTEHKRIALFSSGDKPGPICDDQQHGLRRRWLFSMQACCESRQRHEGGAPQVHKRAVKNILILCRNSEAFPHQSFSPTSRFTGSLTRSVRSQMKLLRMKKKPSSEKGADCRILALGCSNRQFLIAP